MKTRISYIASCPSRGDYLNRFGSQPDVYAIAAAEDDTPHAIRDTLTTTLSVVAGLTDSQIAEGLKDFELGPDWATWLRPYDEATQATPSCLAVLVKSPWGEKHG